MRVGAICPNPAGQVDTLKQILEWQKGGAEEEDTMDVYNIHGFQVHVLQHPLYMWNDKGAPFLTHIYVPEVHHLTKTVPRTRG